MKDKLLRLIDAYIQDDEAINGIAKVTSTHNGWKYEHSYEGVFIGNSKQTKKPDYNQVDSGYVFKHPHIELETFDYYNMTFSFENQPAIYILHRSKKLVIKQKGLGEKQNTSIFTPWMKTVEMTFEFHTSDKPIHYLKCGTFEFDLTDKEVAKIYNKIEDRRLEVSKSAELAELNKRFEKYGIQ
jgi:hypothetical protein